MYNNPMYYNNFFPYNNNNLLKRGLGFLSLKSINWSNVLNTTQKTLNVINQAVPLYYQIKPIWGNAKTMFRMVGALKDDKTTSKEEPIKKNTSSKPVFYL